MIDLNYIKKHAIAKFELNKKTYVILLVDDKISFCYMQNKSIITDFTDEEFNLCASIYNELVIDKEKSVYCGMYKIDGKYFNIFYDTNKDIYFFGRWENGQNVDPTNDELEILNRNYNNQSAVISGILGRKRKKKDIEELNNLTDELQNILEHRFDGAEQTEPTQETEENDEEGLILEETKTIKKIYKIGAAVVAVIILANVAIPRLPGEILFKGKQIEDSINSELKHNSIENESITDHNEIINAILNNKKLSDEEKKFISRVVELLINDNKSKISVEKSIEFFKNLDIQYYPYYYLDSNGKITVNPGGIRKDGSNAIVGEWCSNSNEIKMYQPQYEIAEGDELQEYNFNNCNKIILAHEVMHMFQTEHIFTPVSTVYKLSMDTEEKVLKEKSIFEDRFKEMVDNLYGNEYGNAVLGTNETVGYENYMPAMYAIAEIIPTEAIKKYQFDLDLNHILDELNKIDSDKKKIYELVTSINSISLYEEKVENAINLYYRDETEENKIAYEERRQELIANYRRIRDIISYYYEKKYGKNMNEDIEMLACFFGTDYETEEENQLFREKMGILPKVEAKIIPKGYICEKYINKHKHAKVEVIFQNIGPVHLTVDNGEKEETDERS